MFCSDFSITWGWILWSWNMDRGLGSSFPSCGVGCDAPPPPVHGCTSSPVLPHFSLRIFPVSVQSPGFVKHMGGDRSGTRKLLFIHMASSGFVSKSLEMPSSFLKFHFLIMNIILSFTSPKMSKPNKHFIHMSKDASEAAKPWIF